MTDKPAILLSTPLLAPLAPLLEGRYTVYCLWQGPPVEAAHAVKAIVTAGDFPLEARLLDSLPELGLIACFTAGYDGVDVADARRRGLLTSYAPGANDEDVADHALGLLSRRAARDRPRRP
jgi:lactate dehydrogenase-like 2-hydroxyacid dehydrogenase